MRSGLWHFGCAGALLRSGGGLKSQRARCHVAQQRPSPETLRSSRMAAVLRAPADFQMVVSSSMLPFCRLWDAQLRHLHHGRLSRADLRVEASDVMEAGVRVGGWGWGAQSTQVAGTQHPPRPQNCSAPQPGHGPQPPAPGASTARLPAAPRRDDDAIASPAKGTALRCWFL